MYKKIHQIMRAAEFFVNRRYIFTTNHMTELYHSKVLTDQDREMFNFDITQHKLTEIDNYFKINVLGIRRYIFKEIFPHNDKVVAVKKSKFGLKPWYFTFFNVFVFLSLVGFYYFVKYCTKYLKIS